MGRYIGEPFVYKAGPDEDTNTVEHSCIYCIHIQRHIMIVQYHVSQSFFRGCANRKTRLCRSAGWQQQAASAYCCGKIHNKCISLMRNSPPKHYECVAMTADNQAQVAPGGYELVASLPSLRPRLACKAHSDLWRLQPSVPDINVLNGYTKARSR